MTRCWVSEESSDRPVSQVCQAKSWKRLQDQKQSAKMDREDPHLGMAGEMQSPEKQEGKVGGFCGGKSEAHDKWAQPSILLLILPH